MSLSDAVSRAHDFDPGGFIPFLCGTTRIGWLRPAFAARLALWPDCFACHTDHVALHARLRTVRARTHALAPCVRALARAGIITGWRDETYAIRSTPGNRTLFHIERAAMHRFGLTAFGVNLNGYVDDAAPGSMWIARRSAGKPIDPGMLDTLVGGGIGSGFNAWDTLLKESREEAGIPGALAARATFTGCVHTCREVPDGLHREFVFTYDLVLPRGFVPANQDGEVSDLRLLPAGTVLGLIGRGAFTVEAGLVALDSLFRRGLVDHEHADFHALASALRVARVEMPPI